jgi:hypothetical protein
MPEGSSLTEAEVLELFKTYGENEAFVKFLRDMCASDIRLYFQATNDADRDRLRGAHARTNYFISLIRKSNERRNNSKSGRTS